MADRTEFYGVTWWDARPPAPERRRTALVLPDDVIPWNVSFDPFMRLVDQGRRPAVVLRSLSTDPDHLAARGITDLVPIDQA